MKNYLNKILISFFAVISLGFAQTNYSLSFDGVDDYVGLPLGNSVIPSGTITSRVKFNSEIFNNYNTT